MVNNTCTWCPGCGNFGIWQALKGTFSKLSLTPTNAVGVFDIGCNSNMYNWLGMSAFEGLHGRALPLAEGLKRGNPKLNVLAITGDGGCYGEGGNHLLAAARKNLDLTVLVHNNQVYALTTGQTSPATEKGYQTKSTPKGAPDLPINPVLVSLAAGAGFVARGFSGDLPHLTDLIVAAINHKGFAIVDILQPCITFNSLNTFEWFRKRVYHLENQDTSNKLEAIKKAMEWPNGVDENKIPIGIFYQESFDSLPLAQDKSFDLKTKVDFDSLVREFL